MFSQPWVAWPRSWERRGVILAWGRVEDMIFVAKVLVVVVMEEGFCGVVCRGGWQRK